MPQAEIGYRWVKVDTFMWPAYKLVRTVNSVTSKNVVAGYTGEVLVYQDINNERWLWGFKLRKNRRDTVASGHAPTLEEAQREAELASGRVGGIVTAEDPADAFG